MYIIGFIQANVEVVYRKMLFHWLLHWAILENGSKGLETVRAWKSATCSFKAA